MPCITCALEGDVLLFTYQ